MLLVLEKPNLMGIIGDSSYRAKIDTQPINYCFLDFITRENYYSLPTFYQSNVNTRDSFFPTKSTTDCIKQSNIYIMPLLPLSQN